MRQFSVPLYTSFLLQFLLAVPLLASDSTPTADAGLIAPASGCAAQLVAADIVNVATDDINAFALKLSPGSATRWLATPVSQPAPDKPVGHRWVLVSRSPEATTSTGVNRGLRARFGSTRITSSTTAPLASCAAATLKPRKNRKHHELQRHSLRHDDHGGLMIPSKDLDDSTGVSSELEATVDSTSVVSSAAAPIAPSAAAVLNPGKDSEQFACGFTRAGESCLAKYSSASALIEHQRRYRHLDLIKYPIICLATACPTRFDSHENMFNRTYAVNR